MITKIFQFYFCHGSASGFSRVKIRRLIDCSSLRSSAFKAIRHKSQSPLKPASATLDMNRGTTGSAAVRKWQPTKIVINSNKNLKGPAIQLKTESRTET